MTEKGARDVIHDYLFTSKIGRGDSFHRQDCIEWCDANHRHSRRTYGLQLNKMTMGSAKWSKERHQDGLDDVFIGLGQPELTVFDSRIHEMPEPLRA